MHIESKKNSFEILLFINEALNRSEVIIKTLAMFPSTYFYAPFWIIT